VEADPKNNKPVYSGSEAGEEACSQSFSPFGLAGFPDDITFEGDSERLSCWMKEKVFKYRRRCLEGRRAWLSISVPYLAGFSAGRDPPFFWLATTKRKQLFFRAY